MAVEEKIDPGGEGTEALPSLNFRVQLDNGHEVLAHLAGKMRRYRIRVLPGDRVRVELSPYDLTRGRIVYPPKVGNTFPPPRAGAREMPDRCFRRSASTPEGRC